MFKTSKIVGSVLICMSIFSVLESETKAFKYWHLSELRTSKLHNFIDQVSIIKGLYYCVFTVYCALCNALMSHVRSESSNNKLGRCLFYKCGEGSEKRKYHLLPSFH